MKRVILFLIVSLLAPVARAEVPVESNAKSLDVLLREVREGKAADRELNRKREAEFKGSRDRQASLLEKAKAERVRLEARSTELEASFQTNERELAALEEQLTERLGSLGELFGVVRQVAGDTRAVVQNSIVSAEHTGREANLAKLAESRALPKVDELINLWFAIQQEATESGKVVRFTAPVVGRDGKAVDQEVLRVGPFTALSADGFLQWDSETRSLKELLRQPTGRYLDAAQNFAAHRSGLGTAPIDPAKGAILAVEVERPSIGEQIQFGGIVGYVIITIGIVGILLSVWRYASLSAAGRSMKAQLETDGADEGNPLGRVLSVYQANPHANTETLELKLDEAILRETPKIERWLPLIRVASVIAPLLGLLGTVTGMIQTFQMITLFGTGDPKLMAGGISEALVTTMLGLIVAIPLTFLHSVLRDRSKGLVEILEEQAAGLVAQRAEKTMESA